MDTETKKQIKRIAIQGGYGAFHEIAALHYFGDENVEILPRNTFKDLMKSLKKASGRLWYHGDREQPGRKYSS